MAIPIMKTLQKLPFVFLLLAFLAPLAAMAGDWTQSKKLVLDTSASGAAIDAPVAQLPVLVRLHSGNFVFSEAKADGSDLRFFASDNKTPLKYFVESFDAPNELAMAWVQVPKLAPNVKTDVIWMHWGNPAAAEGSDSPATYDASQILALNFSDKSAFKDATVNGNNPRESTAKPVAFGPVAGAATFDGNSRLVLPASETLRLTPADGWTFSAWVKLTTLDKASLFSLGTGAAALNLELVDGTAVLRQGSAKAQASAALKAGTWQLLTVSYGGGKAHFYLNGVSGGDVAMPMTDASGEMVLGQALRADLDVVMLSRGQRTPAYIKAMASSQAADSTMLLPSDEEETKEISYFAILLGAVTLDGWVVIGILGIMAVVSLWVMITKTLMLGKAEKANLLFLKIFKEQSAEMLQPGHAVVAQVQANETLKSSSIFQLYAVGLSEIAHRFDAQKKLGQNNRLSSAALESIRAALDATIVRSGQRFNSGIVLLTIAISGGPFLGLLGTVVGVMITFAAIAAAGDVNVNAIAPGIAAALVATVAGLAVAIPALFAYNWFAIKIKNISADTQVFADEFLTKSAEIHSD
jgi:biopolymer transport protein ExbB